MPSDEVLCLETEDKLANPIFLLAGVLSLACQPVAAQNPVVDSGLLAAGIDLYQEHCSVCHGQEGRGDGPLSSGLSPSPRDLTTGSYKFRSTEMGEFPAKTDLLRTIEQGIQGSFGQTMPAFDYLTEPEKTALAEVVRFAAGYDAFGIAVAPTARPRAPDLALGKQQFTELGCASCHGATGDGNGKLRDELKDENGHAIKPANLKLGQFKGGNAPEDIWMRIYTGIAGTPMPGFGRNSSPEDIWAVTEYVLTLKK